ncbi:MAG: hypothetical protein KKH20_01950, partial [Proteobacteria bacterium]|nr:hypothetical protein [Pseudomonadota bacterium]
EYGLSYTVSIHAPAWGATKMMMELQQKFKVSIHAPAWGATCKVAINPITIRSFNPRSRMGSDVGRF